MEIGGSRIMVTGATGGIGAVIVTALAGRGADLLLVGRRSSSVEALADRVGATAVVADLAVPSDLERLAAAVGECDALVLNAGVLDGPDQEVLTVNLLAPLRLASEFVGQRQASRRAGAVVFTGSVAGVSASVGMGAYNASKFGLRGYALSLAHELAGTSMSATHLVVGYVRDAGMLVRSGGRPPRGIRTRSPDQVATAVVRAIEDGPAEVWVAPVELRVATTALGVLPRLAGWWSSRGRRGPVGG